MNVKRGEGQITLITFSRHGEFQRKTAAVHVKGMNMAQLIINSVDYLVLGRVTRLFNHLFKFIRGCLEGWREGGLFTPIKVGL